MIHFDLPKEQSSIIKVIGVGGGGGNAVNHMYSQNIDGVNFIICNTDAQALACSKIPNRIQLGPQLTSGLGAGANPEIGRQACEESLEEVKRILEVNTKMVFITAGMGGGTGTGGAPIIAKICKNLGVLTVGIVTMPFAYEGKKRQMQAEEGIKQLKQYVDTLLVISNDKLRHQFGNLKMREAFEKADNVLATAAKCITDVINSTGQINVDFADVCTVMKSGGVAILGSASASGENRAQRAIEEALNSPLLNDNDIKGAKWILININSAEGEHEFTMDEVEIIQSHLLSQAGETTDVILGMGYDSSLGDQIGITLIATGFENKDPFVKPVLKKEEAAEGKIVMTLKNDGVATIPPPVMPQTEVKTTVEVKQPQPQPQPQPVQTKPTYSLEPKLVEEYPLMDAPMPTVEDVLVDERANEEEPLQLFLQTTHANEDITFVSDTEKLEAEVRADEKEETVVFYSPAIPGERILEQPIVKEVEAEKPAIPTGKGFLAKPANIYAEKAEEEISNIVEEQPAAKSGNDIMTLHEKYTVEEEKPALTFSIAPNEPSPVQPLISETDEQELQKRRQMERLQKLRNLSFNVNTNDPSEEFENIPAYIRRNMELPGNTSHIENYYSKFEISSDDQNQGQISTINTFLDGKKPD